MNRPRNSGTAGTFLALFGVLLIGSGLLGLVALVMPNLLAVVGIVALVLFGLIHYVTWGRWLSNRRSRMHDE